MPRKRSSRRRIFWVWKSHLKEGRVLYLWSDRWKAGNTATGAVRVRITIL